MRTTFWFTLLLRVFILLTGWAFDCRLCNPAVWSWIFVLRVLRGNSDSNQSDCENFWEEQTVTEATDAHQIAILSVFVCVDVAFAALGLAKWPPDTVLAYPTNKDVLLICNIQSYDLIFALTYNVIIILLCTFYAFRTRKTPANFNEARYIGFAMYTTCIIWVAFIPVQIGVNKDYATITLSINTTLNATTLLLCIFGPKVYILVLRPTRNLPNKSLNSWRSQEAESQHTTGRDCHSGTLDGPSSHCTVRNFYYESTIWITL